MRFVRLAVLALLFVTFGAMQALEDEWMRGFGLGWMLCYVSWNAGGAFGDWLRAKIGESR